RSLGIRGGTDRTTRPCARAPLCTYTSSATIAGGRRQPPRMVREQAGRRPRAREAGVALGAMTPGPHNAITDVAGVRVGHATIVRGAGPLVPGRGPVRTGVTAVVPPAVDPVGAECNDGYLNDIQGRHVGERQVRAALEGARGGPVEEGNTGAGAGMMAYGFAGGIGTASRRLGDERGGYTVGALVLANF